jgi:hypothetical protein
VPQNSKKFQFVVGELQERVLEGKTNRMLISKRLICHDV